ncbi:MAG: hypothetical protein ACTTI3_01775 [Treponema sp.]
MMKKIRSLLFFSAFFLCVMSFFPLTAESEKSSMYYVNTPIVKIFSHPKGYHIIYRRANLETSEVFIPSKWLSMHVNKADVFPINTRVSPYLSFFIQDGKCEYVRLHIPIDMKSQYWGVQASPEQYNDKFENVETLPLAF